MSLKRIERAHVLSNDVYTSVRGEFRIEVSLIVNLTSLVNVGPTLQDRQKREKSIGDRNEAGTEAYQDD